MDNKGRQKPNKEKRQKIVILPKIYDAGGDLTKEWFVFFSYLDPATERMHRFRKLTGINNHKTAPERMQAAKELADKYTHMLKNGWNPFENKEVIYEDSLEYKATSEQYGRLKKGNKRLLIIMAEFLDTHKPPASKLKTFQTYQSKFRVFAKWLHVRGIEKIQPTLFTTQHAEEFFKYIERKRKISTSTHNQYRMLLIALFEYIRAKRKLSYNPFDSVRRQKPKRKIPNWYNERMVKTITNHLQGSDPQLLIAVKFIYYTYIRPGELRLIKIKHIDFWNNKITIPANVSKNSIEQRVTMPDYLLQELMQLEWHKQQPEFYLFTTELKPGPEPVGVNYFARRYRAHMQVIGISVDYQLYHWKHTGAAIAIQQGINVEAIRQQMRHHDLRVTQDYLESMIAANTADFKTKHKPI